MHPRIAFLPSFVCLIGLAMPAAGGPPRLDRYGDPLPDGAAFRVGTTRLRHPSNYIRPFFHVLFSPNGKYVLSSMEGEHEVCMWEAATGREVRRFSVELASRPSFVLSADGTCLAVSNIFEILLYDTATGKKRRTILLRPTNGAYVCQLAFSRDNKILTASHGVGQPQTYAISRWLIATGKLLGTYTLEKKVYPQAFSTDGRLAVSSCFEDKSICLWETASGKTIREWKLDGKMPVDRSLVISPDGRYVVMASSDEQIIRVFAAANGKEVRSWRIPMRKEEAPGPEHSDHWGWGPRRVVNWLAFAVDGRQLASVDDYCVLHLWDWKSGRELHHFKGVSGRAAFSPDGKTVAAGGLEASIRLWDTKSGRDLCPFMDPVKIDNIAFSPDGRMLAAGSRDGPTFLMDARTGRELKQFPGYWPIAFTPNGERLLVVRRKSGFSGPWFLLDAATGLRTIQFHGAEEEFYCFPGGWNAEKKLLLTGSSASVRVWDTKTGKTCRKIGGQKEDGERSCSPDGRLVALSNRQDDVIRLYAADTGKELRQLEGYNWSVGYQASRGKASQSGGGLVVTLFSPNGKTLLAGCMPNSLGLWDLSTGKQYLRLSCEFFLPKRPIFSPNGDLLCLLDTHGDPCLVDVATGSMRRRLTRQGGDLSWIIDSPRAFSPDGRLLAATYDAHTLVLWETASGRPVRTLSGHGRGQLWQLVFSPDGRSLATVSADGTALVWDVTGLSPDGPLPARKLSPAGTTLAWDDLADADAEKAHRALWSLVADPERALPLLQKHLHPATGPDSPRIARLIADLDDDNFLVRESATRELRKLGGLARPALRAVVKNRASPELRRRVEGLLDNFQDDVIPAESLRELRAVAVLEQIASDQARHLLGTLTSGAPAARLTREAKASLARLRSRRVQP